MLLARGEHGGGREGGVASLHRHLAVAFYRRADVRQLEGVARLEAVVVLRVVEYKWHDAEVDEVRAVDALD